MVSLPDLHQDEHQHILEAYNAALAPGTWINRKNQAHVYLSYMTNRGLDPLTPSEYHLTGLIVHLSKKFKSPATVSNYMSGAANWVALAGGNRSTFTDGLVRMVRKGIGNMSSHQVKKAPAISPDDIKHLVTYLRSAGPEGVVLEAAFLIGYLSLVRQSNLLTPALDMWGGAHTIRRQDISQTPLGLCLRITSSKTIKREEDMGGPPHSGDSWV